MMRDHQRLRQLMDDHHAALARYVGRRLPIDEVDDVVADVFATAWRRLADIDERVEQAWLYGAARNTIAHRQRAHTPRAAG